MYLLLFCNGSNEGLIYSGRKTNHMEWSNLKKAHSMNFNSSLWIYVYLNHSWTYISLPNFIMKKSKLNKIIVSLDNFIRMNEVHMQIQDGAILRKDKEITIANAALWEIKKELEETKTSLERSRWMVTSLRCNSDSRSINDMAATLYLVCNHVELNKSWHELNIEEQEHWMMLVVDILSWSNLQWRW